MLGSTTGGASMQLSSQNARKHILCVTTYQMCILLLFNLRDKLTYEEIVQVKNSESSFTKDSIVTKDLAIADPVKMKSANDNSRETMSANVENQDNRVIDDDTKILEGTRTKETSLKSTPTKDINQ